MNPVSSTNNNYVDLVQQATRRNTLEQANDSRKSGESIDVEKTQQSNQEIKDDARETGVELYTQQLVKNSFETYAETSQNNPYSTSNDDSDDESEQPDIYTFDPQTVNDALGTAQKRTLATELYDNKGSQNQSNNPTQPDFENKAPINIYV